VPLADLASELHRLSGDPGAALFSEKTAWRELAQAWGLQLGDGDPCTSVQQQQLRCYRGGNTLATIRQLDRPGILTLYIEHERPVYVLLTGLNAQSAMLSLGGVLRVVSLADLAQVWRGDYATYWRAPPGYAAKAVEGNSGPPTMRRCVRGCPRSSWPRGSSPTGRPGRRRSCRSTARWVWTSPACRPCRRIIDSRSSRHVLHPRRLAQGRFRA